MAGETKNGMQCAEFDALLIEALDGDADRTEAGELSGPCPGLRRLRTAVRGGRCGPALAEVAGRGGTSCQPGAQHSAGHHGTREQARRRPARRPEASWTDAITAWLRPVFAPVLCHEPPAPLRHVIRNGVLLAVNFTEPGGCEGERCAACGPAAQRDQAHLLRDHRTRGEVLRKHSLRVRNRIAGAGIQTSDRSP